ncbi:MAG TPA: bifunctional phosphopantothenoylcysteine decarboxylase/phosphopantothenate--cysteine ligase CoaBC, partial [Fimbriimonadaceae bacterium]|nr:bifunctional phosphopantothenoylcysteine decarboxylase/phosphopantothenate--cysteine ligase CoaBC [Armatimonadota bacterium]HRI75335.1 bifunctional phosphopantothenoylcysteine decarboxylase/phosphopantothenate--cysteine ligase CoaBC [Fimbriimonadaceae bacterium]
MPTVVLGITGSVAAYRAADLARDLMRAGFTVRACLTEGAQEFVQPALFEALTGQPVLQSAFDEPEPGRMAHIDWARQADLLLIAPATAHTLNRLAAGIADDMLTTIALVYDGPVVVAPAMNPSMLAHPATQASLQTLQERGVVVVDPVGGLVACGEEGQGKLAANETILQTALAAAQQGKALAGQRVLITSGPTQEAIDDVRYLSNRSSGRMGAALAQAALMQGA